LGGRKGIRPVKNGGWWRWTLVSPDGVAPSRMVIVSASVDLPLHHKVQKFSSGTSSPGWPRKRAVKWLWWWRWLVIKQRSKEVSAGDIYNPRLTASNVLAFHIFSYY